MAKNKQVKHKPKPKKKGLKNSFYEVEAPMTNTKITLYGFGPEYFKGSVVKLDLTKSLRGKSFEYRLRIKADGEKLSAEAISLKLVMSYIRRVMRKGTDYVEDSFEMNCRNKRVRIKPFMITRNKVSRAVRNSLRKNAMKHLIAKLKIRTSDEIFSEIMSNKIQKDLSIKLKKIYPLAFCEIRAFEVVGEKTADEVVEKEDVEEISETESNN